MASVSPAVPHSIAASSAFPSVQLSRTNPVTGSTPPIFSSVILSVSTALQVPILYTASGLPTFVLADIARKPAPDSNTAQTTPPTPTVTPVAIPASTPTAAVSVVIPAATENTGAATDIIAPLAATTVIDPDVSTLADFLANPVFGGMATALYMNAANYRSHQIPSADAIVAIDLPEPVTAIRAVNVAIADGKPQSPENRRRAATSSSG